MDIVRPKNDLVEIFGYAPNDTSSKCRILWKLGACPFVNRPCKKTNHDKSVIYGTCSATTRYGDCIICPDRFYGDNLNVLRDVSRDAFGDVKFLTFAEYMDIAPSDGEFVVALGMYSGHEISIKSLSMDWILAKIYNSSLISYVGIEVQSLDITNNYRDNWYAYRNIAKNAIIPSSEHGLNWANVHKRLIPQIIRKGLIYSKSDYVHSGLYFITPEIVYKKFEEIIGGTFQ